MKFQQHQVLTLGRVLRLATTFVVLCTAVAIDLTIAVYGAGWWHPIFDSLPPYFRPAPGNHVIAVLALLLSALALKLALPGPARHRRLWLVGSSVLTVIWGGTYFASTLGENSVATWLVWTLGLFVGVVDPGPQSVFPLSFQLARFCGLATLFTVAGSVVLTMARGRLDRFWLSRAKDVDVVVGLDQHAVDLAKALIRDRKNDNPSRLRRWAAHGVVVVHSTQSHPAIEELRRHGCRIVVGDLTSNRFLRDLLLTRGRPTVHRLFALTPSETENTRIVIAAKALVELHSASQPGLHIPRLIARYDDPRRARQWRLANLGAAQCFVDAITQEELTARALVQRIWKERAEEVIILGDTALTSALLFELATERAFRHELAEVESHHVSPPPKPFSVDRVLVCHPLAQHTVDEWTRNRAPASDLPTPLAVTAHGESWEQLLKSRPAQAPTAVVIVGEPTSDMRARATRLSILFPDCSIFVPEPGVVGLAEDIHAPQPHRLNGYGLTLLMGQHVPEDSWTTIARQTHEVYVASSPPSKAKARRHWDGDEPLPLFFREDTLRQQRQLMTKIHEAHQWGVKRSPANQGTGWAQVSAGETGAPIGDAVILWLAQAEHKRWCSMRLRHGWSTADPSETDPVEAESRLRNKNLVDWQSGEPLEARHMSLLQRSDTTMLQEWNKESIRRLLHRLWIFGIAPAQPSGHRFRRSGRAHAMILDQPRTWKTSDGSTLTAARGDWWVTDTNNPDGRGVAAKEFASLYHPESPNFEGQYERVGEVTARQAQIEDIIVTLEGEALVGVGDWIVTDDRGNSWPVPQSEFSKLYKPSIVTE
ncbi:hypothetical protein [Paenarthrobacter sp. NPDC089316]|uniref:hypothetical protein n=1 Tax=unclassified Paenarthrobacter TaxID=2634190 RepID=UPI00343DCFCC